MSDERYVIPDGADLSHVHLKVAELERSLAFYTGVLGYTLMQRLGDQAAFISAGGYHHHIGLNTWESRGAPPAPPGRPGLYHFAIRYPSRRDLAVAVKRVLDAGIALQGASDHGVSVAIYLADPDGNGIEMMYDRPRAEWPRGADGRIEMGTQRLDLRGLLAEAEVEVAARG